MPQVDFIRQEIVDLTKSYELIRDCIGGEVVVKSRSAVYLPIPNAADLSDHNVARYAGYLVRAVFYNVTRRTLAGLVGEVFSSAPEMKLPPLLDPMLKDADGHGTTLEQLAKKTVNYVIPYSRAGVLADFPSMDRSATRAELVSGEVAPTITVYAPWDIINWRASKRKGRVALSLVVLRESYEKPNNDPFVMELEVQYRVLKVEDGVYVQEIWREDKNVPVETIVPLDSKGRTLSEIPFRFIGKQNNSPEVESPEFYDLASLNLAHYRNSAEYEDSVFMVGQPTPIFTGLSEAWVTGVLGGIVPLGSRAAVPLPVGADAKLLQAEPNTLVGEAMEKKERQMVALGARLVEQKTVQRTATEAGLETSSEMSSLVSIVQNVSSAFRWCLEWCAIFVGAETIKSDIKSDSVTFNLNEEFAINALPPDQLRSVIEAWQKEAISFTEMRISLRKSGMAKQEDKDAKKEIAADAEAALVRNTAEIEATSKAAVIPDDPNEDA